MDPSLSTEAGSVLPRDSCPPKRQHQPRRGSGDVSLDTFDPSGVQQLARTLSHIGHEGHGLRPGLSRAQSSSLPREIPEDLDFNRLVQKYLKKCVVWDNLHQSQTHGHYVHRRDESDIKSRQLGVLFYDLKVEGMGASASLQPTLGSLLNPMNIIHVIQSLRHPPLRNIISGFEGVVRPGEMLCESRHSDDYHSL